MSKNSIKSRLSNRSLLRQKNRSKNDRVKNKKENGFCCGTGDYDPLFKYDQRNSPFKSSLTAINSVHECPVLKLRTQFFEHIDIIPKKKGFKPKRRFSKVQLQWIDSGKSPSAIGTLQKFLEDDIDMIIDKEAFEKQEIFRQEKQRNIKIGIEKVRAERIKGKTTHLPHWYKEFSKSQMKYLMKLKDALSEDFQEKEIGRTQNTLRKIGITSTFLKLNSNEIKSLQQKSDIRAIQLLREIYKIMSGVDFETEGPKQEYNCNEKLTLSAIAFLSFPETIIELSKRLPSIPEIPPEPKPPRVEHPRKMDNPYKESLFLPPNLRLHQKELYVWFQKYRKISRPKAILPLREVIDTQEVNTEIEEKGEPKKAISLSKIRSQSSQRRNTNEKFAKNVKEPNKRKSRDKSVEFNKNFNFDTSDSDGPKEYKILDIEKTPKSWLGEKVPKYILTGICNEANSEYPVTFELTGVANVTPNNSNEEFFAKLKRGDEPKKVYPQGREYLSNKWQQWLQNEDEEFFEVEKKANKLIENVGDIMKLVIPGPTCDSCCACRQARKTNLKMHATKTPHMVIESVAEDPAKNKNIIGSVAMHSPAPSLTESTENFSEAVASSDKVTNHLLMNGVTEDNGKTIYNISGVTKDTEHTPEKQIEKQRTKSTKNVPSCACAIQKIFTGNLEQEPSNDNILQKKDGICPGKKYRPKHGPAYSCKLHPDKKSCCQNPFRRALEESRKKDEIENTNQDSYPPGEQNMFGPPAFQPCGKEDRMAKDKSSENEKTKLNTKDNSVLKKELSKLGSEYAKSPGQSNQKDPRTSESREKKFNKKNSLAVKSLDEELNKMERKYSRYPDLRKEQKDSLNFREQNKKEKRASSVESNVLKREKNNTNDLKMNNENKQSISSAREPTAPSSKRSNSKEPTKLMETKTKKQGINKKPETDKNTNHWDTNSKKLPRRKSKNESSLLPKSNSTKKPKKTAEHESRQEQMKKLKEEIRNFQMLPDFEVRPAIIPEQPKSYRQEHPERTQSQMCLHKASEKEEGPFGWRTASEQMLAPEKTLIYLAEPMHPVESVPVRPGGKPCHCRVNRNNKKVLKYIGGLSSNIRRKYQNVTQVIEGSTYVTPPFSPRRSDEYIPEYELYESPYDLCVSNKNNTSQFIEKSFNTTKIPEKKSCSCGKGDEVVDSNKNKNNFSDEKEVGSNKWNDAFKDQGLMEFYSKYPDNFPCWLKCSKFLKKNYSKKTRNLQVKKPVCECKYERKIVKRKEDKKKWLDRQMRLKSCKKVPITHVAGISRPMESDKRFIISGVQKMNRDENDKNNEIKYCVSGIAENYRMGPVQHVIEGVYLQSPVVTPKSSETNNSRVSVDEGSIIKQSENVQNRKNSKKVKENRLRDMIGSKREKDKLTNKNLETKEETGKKENKDKKTKQLNISNSRKSGLIPETVNFYAEDRKESNKLLVPLNNQKLLQEKNEIPLEVHYPKIDLRQISREIKCFNQKNTEDKLNLKELMKKELKKMSSEGFIFAKLPECYKFPQINYWIQRRITFFR